MNAAWFFGGLVIGVGGCALFAWLRRGSTEALLQRALDEYNRAEERDRYGVFRETVGDVIKGASSEALRDALSTQSESFLSLAETRLEAQSKQGEEQLSAKKEAISGELDRIAKQLGQVETLVKDLEKDREHKFGALTEAIAQHGNVTAQLGQTTAEIHKALASSQARGEWGEWVAENILNLVGLSEGVDFSRQKTIEASGTRPDFTFNLPKGLRVNMDVKFPFANYWSYLNTDDADARGRYEKSFLTDVRQRIKEVTTRDYIDPHGGTVNYVLVFIPNEQVFAFIQEKDQALVNDALKQKVILCSPFTLYALLSIMHEAASIFALEQRSEEILGLLGQIRKQWELFKDSMSKMGKKIDEAGKEYERLVTTRANQLDRPFRKVEALRERGGEIEAEAVAPRLQAGDD